MILSLTFAFQRTFNIDQCWTKESSMLNFQFERFGRESIIFQWKIQNSAWASLLIGWSSAMTIFFVFATSIKSIIDVKIILGFDRRKLKLQNAVWLLPLMDFFPSTILQLKIYSWIAFHRGGITLQKKTNGTGKVKCMHQIFSHSLTLGINRWLRATSR